MINCTITNEDIKAFHENGFLIKEKFLQEKYISLLLSKFDPLFKGEFPNGIAPDEWNWVHGKDSRYLTRQICNAWKSDDRLSISNYVASGASGSSTLITERVFCPPVTTKSQPITKRSYGKFR